MADELALTLIGGPTVLVETAGLRLLTDPTFDEPGSYEARGVTLTKNSGPAVGIDALGPVDAVLLSHDQHFDNLDHAGRALLPRVERVFTTLAGAGRLGGHAVGMAPWASETLTPREGGALTVTAAPARHGPVGIEPVSGDVIGFVITPDHGKSIYISGDTVWYEGVAEVARRFDVGVAVLFTGSAQPRGAFHMTMDSNDAIEAAHAFKDATIVAVHNEGWEHFIQSQDDLARAFAVVGLADRLVPLPRGQRVSLKI